MRGGRRGRRPKNRFPPAPIETREVTINEADNKQTEVETLDDTLSGDEELEKTPPKSPEKTPNPAPFPPTTTEAPTKTKPATETPKSTKNTGKGGGTSGCARATFRSTSTKSISMDELDEHLSNKRPVGIGLTGPLPAMAPFAPPHPGVPFTPFVGVGNQAFNPFPAGFYGSGIPLPTTVPPMFAAAAAAAAAAGVAPPPAVHAHMPNLVRKPPFGFNPVAPMPVPVSAPPFLNRSFSSHHPSFSHSPSSAPSTGLKCHQCFLVLDGPASLNSHMETFHGRVASDAADASVGIEGDVKCKNCDLSFPSVIELGRHIAKDGC